MVATADPYRKYLDPAVLAGIHGLDLRARMLARGFVSGIHRSPAHGYSVEFAEHRKYCQGDDLRFLDWRVYGRTDKHYIKEYEQESNVLLLLAVDTSESMNYRWARSPMSKRDYAITVAAALAYLALQQRDAVELVLFDDQVHRTGRASNHRGKWKSIIRELAQARMGPRTDFRRVFDELAETVHVPHLVVIISDLFCPADDVLAGVGHLRHARNEPVVLQVLDRAERTFPFERPTQWDGLESEKTVRAAPGAVRDLYLRELGEFLDRLRQGFHKQRTDYALLDTTASPAAALRTFLAVRSARARRWR